MIDAARKNNFWHRMDALRGRAERPIPSEIARIARDTGLSPRDALIEIQRFTEFGRAPTGEPHDAASAFLHSLCKKSKAKRVLEYTSMPMMLSTAVIEANDVDAVDFVAPAQQIADTLTILFEDKPVSASRAIGELDLSSRFDVIICQPPIGYRPPGDTAADGFGGEIISQLVPFLAENGTLFWMTARGVLFTPRPKKTLSELANSGVHTMAAIDIAPGGFPGTSIEGVLIALSRKSPSKRFVGALRDRELADPMAAALHAGHSKRSGPSWTWLEPEDQRFYADLERERLLQKLMPRGRHELRALGSLLANGEIQRADKPVGDEADVTAFLFVPEYAGSRATADLEEQTVKPKSVYRLAIDTTKANPRFLALLLNGPYGKQIKASAAKGATIQRVSAAGLLALKLPIPDMATQDQIARIDSDIALLKAAFRDMQETLDQDWSTLPEITEKTDGLKAVVDLDRQIADWWRELPYPLATIYRRYQVTTEPKDRLDTLLHFFEMAAVYLAALGTSHVKALRQDWERLLAKWLHPTGAAGVERANFGFWTGVAGASHKDLSRIASDKKLRENAIEMAGPDLFRWLVSSGRLGRPRKFSTLLGAIVTHGRAMVAT